VNGRLAYNISDALPAGANLSYDQAFETRFSADLKYRFGSNGYGAPSKKKAWQTPVIQSLTESVRHREVRVHDDANKCNQNNSCTPGNKYYSKLTKYGLQSSRCAVETGPGLNPTKTYYKCNPIKQRN
jgi:hypothetical protein